MITENYLESIKKQLLYYKMLADKTIALVPEEKINWQYNAESNSIDMIMRHIAGNMLSRFTDFLTTDGEKEWRNRDAEFEQQEQDKSSVVNLWETAWEMFFNTLNSLKPEDLQRIVYIRNEGHTVVEAINRQLAHYPYHIGQIVFLGKMISGTDWVSLSIPKGDSGSYNKAKFEEPKQITHFTDSMLPKQQQP